jgi:hypothetical protein
MWPFYLTKTNEILYMDMWRVYGCTRSSLKVETLTYTNIGELENK